MMRLAVFALAALLVHGADIPPTGKPARLFNGKDLKGFDTWLEKQGLNKDPDRVFRVKDGVIHVSGAEYGYFVTKKEYSGYYLKCEFKWGEKTYAPRLDKARDSGILFHVTGPNMIWPRSIEFQFIEGGTGDILVVGGVELTVKGETKTKGRFDRFGKGLWKDVAGYRDPNGDLEKPRGEWNLIEMIADGDLVRYWVNGRLANEGSGAGVKKGKILFQSEGAEIYFRNIELAKLKN